MPSCSDLAGGCHLFGSHGYRSGTTTITFQTTAPSMLVPTTGQPLQLPSIGIAVTLAFCAMRLPSAIRIPGYETPNEYGLRLGCGCRLSLRRLQRRRWQQQWWRRWRRHHRRHAIGHNGCDRHSYVSGTIQRPWPSRLLSINIQRRIIRVALTLSRSPAMSPPTSPEVA